MVKLSRDLKTCKPIALKDRTIDYILNGSCTCLRVPAYKAPHHHFNGEVLPYYKGEEYYKPWEYGVYVVGDSGSRWLTNILKCPYGKPGSLLYVRERYAFESKYNGLSLTQVKELDDNPKVVYHYDVIRGKSELLGWWRRGSDGPPWAMRTKLKITSTKLERLVDHDKNDIFKEGPFQFDDDCIICNGKGIVTTRSSKSEATCACSAHYLGRYAEYWDSIQPNYKTMFETNPWTWVIHFERME